ncbi:hypothetical protein C9427_33655, partial [Mesorhizobium helmanticense]
GYTVAVRCKCVPFISNQLKTSAEQVELDLLSQPFQKRQPISMSFKQGDVAGNPREPTRLVNDFADQKLVICLSYRPRPSDRWRQDESTPCILPSYQLCVRRQNDGIFPLP